MSSRALVHAAHAVDCGPPRNRRSDEEQSDEPETGAGGGKGRGELTGSDGGRPRPTPRCFGCVYQAAMPAEEPSPKGGVDPISVIVPSLFILNSSIVDEVKAALVLST